MSHVETLVVKVGTSTLTGEEDRLDVRFIHSLAEQIASLMDEGHRVVLITSGAVRAGVEQLGWARRPRALPLRQAAAAVGQGRLMALYADAFSVRGRSVAQILLTRQLAQDRATYVNAQNTLGTLIRHAVLPIVNENDTVATEELQFGDNDTLAALVAALVSADLLVLLTNVPGLQDAEGVPLRSVATITAEIRSLAGGAGPMGSGGMATKLAAAEIAGHAGIPTIVAPGRHPDVLRALLRGEPVGTRFEPGARRLQGRKHWLAHGVHPLGVLIVNAAARAAVVNEHRSLLAAGILRVEGEFAAGETVSLRADSGDEFARGLVEFGRRDVERLLGRHTREVTALTGAAAGEMVHRDNLVVLADVPHLRADPVHLS